MHEFADSKLPDPLGRRLRRLIGGCFISFALILSVGYGAIWWQMKQAQEEAMRSLDWAEVSAVITRSEVVDATGLHPTDARPTRRTGPAFRPVVEYRYEVGGTALTGNRLSVGVTIYETADEAQVPLEPYPVGARAIAHFDPEDPGRAVLVPGPATFDNTYFYAFGGGFLAIFIVLALVARGILRIERGSAGP